MTLDGQPGETGRSLVVDLELVVDDGSLLFHVLGGRVEDEERPQEHERRQ